MMSRLMSSTNWVILAMAALHTPAIIAQRASTNIVFKIGVFDRSSEEFAKGTPTRPDTLVIGQGDSSKGWHAIQPVRPIAATPTLGENVESSPPHHSVCIGERSRSCIQAANGIPDRKPMRPCHSDQGE